MDEISSVIEVKLGEELILPLESVPEYHQLLQLLEERLKTPASQFKLYAKDTGQLVHDTDSFTQVFAEATLPLVLSVEVVPTAGFFCPFCDKELEVDSEQCQTCQSVNWDAWFISKYGEEKYRNLQETRHRSRGFTFGPPSSHPPGSHAIFEQETKSFERKEQPEDDFDLNQRDSLGDFRSGSFGDLQEKFKTPPRKIRPDGGFTTTDGLVDIETPPQSKVTRKEDISPPPAALSDSPEIKRTESTPQRPVITSGLRPSPYLTPEKKVPHDRSTCSICQRSQRTASLLSGTSDYRDSLFRYSKATEEANIRRSSPLRSSKLLTEASLFESKGVSQSFYGSNRREIVREEEMYSGELYARQLRSSGNSGSDTQETWRCPRCKTRPPWYFSHCQQCELEESLALQPSDSYKRRVQLMCRRS